MTPVPSPCGPPYSKPQKVSCGFQWLRLEVGFSVGRSPDSPFHSIRFENAKCLDRLHSVLRWPVLTSSPQLLISLLATPLHIQGFQRVSSDVDSPHCGRTVTFGEYKLVWSHSGASLLLIRSSSSSSSQALRSPFGNYSRSAHTLKTLN